MREGSILRGHGGRIDAAARLYPTAPTPWLDLSTGINPSGYPVPPVPAAAWQRLPLASELKSLVEAAVSYYGLPAGMALLPVPGSELAVRLMPVIGAATGLGGPVRVGIVGPTYASHAAAWGDAGADVRPLAALPDLDASDRDLVVLVNPNNPDGRAISRAELVGFATAWTADGRRLVVDEAFGDVAPELSLLAAPVLPRGVTVLRSLGKFFGLAGLRVGFVAVPEAEAPAWQRLTGDWPVSGPAALVAAQALGDAAWIAAMRARLSADRRRLEAILDRAGLAIVGATDLFVLAEAPEGLDLVDRFARAGILIRGFAQTPRHFRFGLPGDEAGWRRLEAVAAGLAG